MLSLRYWVFMLLLAAACTTTEDAQVTLGRQVYSQYCAECHGANGEGQRPDAPMERDETGRFPAPPHNSTGHTWHHDDDLLLQIIREGGMGDPADFHEMPAFGGTLTEEEIQAVLAYIKTLWTEEQRAAQRAVTEAMRQRR